MILKFSVIVCVIYIAVIDVRYCILLFFFLKMYKDVFIFYEYLFKVNFVLL